MATEYKLSYTGEQINAKLSEIDNLAKKNEIPVTTSDLANDSGFITSDDISNHNSDVYAHTDIRNKIGQLFSEKADKSGMTLGVHTDGFVYLFVDGSPQGNGLDIKTDVVEGDVFGYVDENNVVVLSGSIPDGNYTIKYEMEDGRIINIGELVLDNNIYYSVTNTLSNCTNNNSVTSVVEGGSYTATITPNNGYALKSVAVTMGGTSISVNGGNISIAEVTGDIVITAVAEKTTVTPSYANLLPLSVDTDGSLYNGGKGYKSGYRLSKSANGGEVAQDGMCCSGFMPIAATTDTVRIKNITWHATSGWNIIFFYDSTKAYIGATYFSTDMLSGDIYTFKPSAIGAFAGAAFFRFTVGEISDETVVTVNQEIV